MLHSSKGMQKVPLLPGQLLLPPALPLTVVALVCQMGLCATKSQDSRKKAVCQCREGDLALERHQWLRAHESEANYMETEFPSPLGPSVAGISLLVDRLLTTKDGHFQLQLPSLTLTMTVSTSVPRLLQHLPCHPILLTLLHPYQTSHLHLLTFRYPSKI